MAEFKTSFIPKQKTPLKDGQKKHRRGGLGFLGFLALIIFLLSLVGTGALYLYKIVLEGNIEKMSASIARVEEAIDPELIERLRDVDARIETAKLLLANRTIASPIFRLLEDDTLQSIGYSQMEFLIDNGGETELRLQGEAKDYSSLALQSDIFGETKSLESPIFESLRLDERGNVSFSFKTPLARSLLLYENNLNAIPRFVTEENFSPTSSDDLEKSTVGEKVDSSPTKESAEDDLTTIDEELDGFLEGLGI
ncbi:MAG: hypothetical protein WD003_00320 [Candidatus Paceibacterota bacterium]